MVSALCLLDQLLLCLLSPFQPARGVPFMGRIALPAPMPWLTNGIPSALPTPALPNVPIRGGRGETAASARPTQGAWPLV